MKAKQIEKRLVNMRKEFRILVKDHEESMIDLGIPSKYIKKELKRFRGCLSDVMVGNFMKEVEECWKAKRIRELLKFKNEFSKLALV